MLRHVFSLLLMAVAPNLGGAQTIQDSLAGKACNEHTFVVAPGTQALTVTLSTPSATYFDTYGTTDFDLRVSDPQGRRTGGWTCSNSTAPTEIPGATYNGLSASPESVGVRSPTPGQWTVTVWAYLGSGAYAVSVDQRPSLPPGDDR